MKSSSGAYGRLAARVTGNSNPWDFLQQVPGRASRQVLVNVALLAFVVTVANPALQAVAVGLLIAHNMDKIKDVTAAIASAIAAQAQIVIRECGAVPGAERALADACSSKLDWKLGSRWSASLESALDSLAKIDSTKADTAKDSTSTVKGATVSIVATRFAWTSTQDPHGGSVSVQSQTSALTTSWRVVLTSTGSTLSSAVPRSWASVTFTPDSTIGCADSSIDVGVISLPSLSTLNFSDVLQKTPSGDGKGVTVSLNTPYAGSAAFVVTAGSCTVVSSTWGN